MDLTMRTDRTDELPASVDVVWEHLESTERYQTWWPWLGDLAAGGLRQGDVWSCTVSSPLPLRLRLDVGLDGVEHRRRIEAEVAGDIAGPARLELVSRGDTCLLRLRAELTPHRRALRLLTAAARPVARRSHDHVISRGIEQLRGVLASSARR